MRSLLKKPSAWLPIAMSFAALLLIVANVVFVGINREPHDEGTAAHLFQLLMGLQVPIIAYFAIKWLPKKPKLGLKIVAIQIFFIFVPFLLVYLLEL